MMNSAIFSVQSTHTATDKLQALEHGQVLFYQDLGFTLEEGEHILLSDKILDGKHKNTSYDYRNDKLGGFNPHLTERQHDVILKKFMKRFALHAKALVQEQLPWYQDALLWGRTSYRPAEILGRHSSKRKDDTRLHVDAFPATPVNGHRILRVFCNINPNHEPRVWHLGEPFIDVMNQFAKKIPTYNPFKARLLYWLKATKTIRSAYDHYMLHLHDAMKLDDAYQERVQKERFDFPAQSSWMVFTDVVSHAALGGQYLLEQTFYLPVPAMHQSETSPLHHWSGFLNQKQTEHAL